MSRTFFLLVALGVAGVPIANHEARTSEPAPPQGERPTRTDRYGDPLPVGAVARVGTLRFYDGDQYNALAFVAGGRVLASSTQGGPVRLWDTATGKELRALARHKYAASALAASPDGKTLATPAYEEPLLRIWEVHTGKELRQLTAGAGGTRALAFAPDGKTLAAAAKDSIIRLWETTGWRQVGQLAGHRDWISSVAFLPDGKTLVSGGEDGTIRLWDVAAGRERRRLADNVKGLWEMTLSPDGRTLACSERQGTLRLWEVATGKEVRRLTGGQDAFWSVAFSPDGRHLASGGLDLRLRIWDVATGEELRGRTGGHHVQRVAYSPDGKTVATGGGGMIRLWRAATLQPALELPGHPEMVLTVRFSADGKRLFSGSWGGAIGAWNAFTGVELSPLRRPPAGLAPLPRLAIPPALTGDGRRAAMVDTEGRIRVWEPDTGKQLASLGEPQSTASDSVFSPDGRTVAAVHRDGLIRVWDVATAKELLRFGGPPPNYRSPAFCPDGKLLVTTQDNGPVVLWDTATGKELRRLPWPEGAGAARALFSSDGTTLAAWGRCPTPDADPRHREMDMRQVVLVWDVATGKELSRIEEPVYSIDSAALSPDARTLAVGVPREIHLWELASRKERCRLSGHRGAVYSLAFAPDGRLLASGSSDHTALCWDVTGLAPDGRLRPVDLRPDDLTGLWDDLAGADGVRAHQAIWRLVAGAAQSVAFLRQHLSPVAAAEPGRLAQLLADLDSDRFDARARASARLIELGHLAEAALRKALQEQPSPEVRRRIQAILDELDLPLTSQRLRQVRAVEVLEQIGTPGAREVLRALATGAAQARLTREAKASLERGARRGPLPHP
jgi:WD40 repeat protein